MRRTSTSTARLHGLSRKDEAFSQLVRGATRSAFSNVVDLAIEEGASFVVIAGDLYDGAWKDHATGQFAIAQLARLARAGIRSFIVVRQSRRRKPRHPAPHHAGGRLQVSKREVRDRRLPRSRRRDPWPQLQGGGDVREHRVDLLPADRRACSTWRCSTPRSKAHEGHAQYAPCSVGELQAAGHDYWALGHVHDHAVRSTTRTSSSPATPRGGTSARPVAKGAVVVQGRGRHRPHVEHRASDEVRWAHAPVDAGGARDHDRSACRNSAGFFVQSSAQTPATGCRAG